MGEPFYERAAADANRRSAISAFAGGEQHSRACTVQFVVIRPTLAVLLALTLAPQAPAAANPKQVKPDRAAITALLDEFIPAVVAQKDLKRGWRLVDGVAKTVPYKEWIKGNTSVQTYPVKGRHFPGWIVGYSYPGDVGFDILLQPTKKSVGPWSFRAEAQRIHGRWKITTWYPVATYAPVGRTQTVLGPNDLGPANGSASASVSNGRLPPWVLVLPVALLGAIALGCIGYGVARWARQRSRERELQRSLASDR
jgi:hypothetical protein